MGKEKREKERTRAREEGRGREGRYYVGEKRRNKEG